MKDGNRHGYAKLLDTWVPPKDAGEAVGCAATSFTFSPAFFEEECLARFLNLESDPQEDGPIYLIEREEKLANIACAAALVDVRHCRGRRSLRWDLLPVRVPGGVLHAKITLLCWQQHIRLIVASANLTEDGYRRNQEVFGTLEYSDGSNASLPVLQDFIDFLREIAAFADTTNSPTIGRWEDLLRHVESQMENWSLNERVSAGPRIAAVLVGPQRPSALEQLQMSWPSQRPPSDAHIVSPFFDPPSPHNGPAKKLWTVLRRRGAASTTYHITAENLPDSDRLYVNAPASLLEATPETRAGVKTYFARVREADLPNDEQTPFRPLHAKLLWLENDDWVASMIGSSNFTTSGLGIGRSPNIEANLVYAASPHRTAKLVRALEAAQIRGDPISDPKTWEWHPKVDETQEQDDGPPQLPDAFGTAVLSADERGRQWIELTFTGTPPENWRIYPEDHGTPVYGETAWRDNGSPHEVILPWDQDLPPTGLEVDWKGAPARAWWPINIADATTLPPPAELRSLSLEALIHILTSARPLKEALRTWLNRQRKLQQAGVSDTEVLDPHKRVDTTNFLLQRTRRISWAFNGLRDRLERPVPTRQSLHWRLYGPVGINQVAEALKREQHSSQEYAFLMAELLMELTRIRPQAMPGCLSPETIKDGLTQFIKDMRPQIESEATQASPATQRYITKVLQYVDTTMEII